MKRFLIVEDDALNCKVLEDFMSDFAVCDTASSGAHGLELFEKAIIDGHPYDLICTDLVMPGIDGHEFIRLIREREESLPIAGYIVTKIFVISASGSPKDMTRAILDNSCDDYLVKPFERRTLKALLQKYDLIEYDNEP